MSLLRIDQRQEDQNLLRIESEIIRPIQINESQATFILRNKGLLDKKTQIVLPVVSQTCNGEPCFQLPIGTGIMSLIKDATLTAGGVTIASTIDVAEHYTARQYFKSLEERGNIEQARKGISTEYGVSPTGTSVNANGGGLYAIGSSCVNGGVRYETPANGTDPRSGAVKTPYALSEGSAGTARFYFSLEDLFPHLFQVLMMPLGSSH